MINYTTLSMIESKNYILNLNKLFPIKRLKVLDTISYYLQIILKARFIIFAKTVM